MFDLLDKAFWKFVSGFVLILVVSFSLLAVFGAFRETKENLAALIAAFQKEE